MYVEDILRRKSPRVVTIRTNETVGIAAQLMRTSNVGALVVKDTAHSEGHEAVAMFTERDVVRAIAERGAAGFDMKVSQLISMQQFFSCGSKDTLERVQDIMSRHHVRHLPVVDNDSLIGVISTRDVASLFEESAANAAQAA